MLQDEFSQLQYIKDNLFKNNKQLAEDLGLSFGALKWLMRRNNITRSKDEYSSLRKEMGKKYSGERNPNWRGGIQKDFMRYKKLQQLRYPEHVAARKQARKALRKGELVKKPCEICFNENVQMHHEDYSKPLEVIFLCVPHHKMADKYLKAGIKFLEIKEQLKTKKAS